MIALDRWERERELLWLLPTVDEPPAERRITIRRIPCPKCGDRACEIGPQGLPQRRCFRCAHVWTPGLEEDLAACEHPWVEYRDGTLRCHDCQAWRAPGDGSWQPNLTHSEESDGSRVHVPAV